MRRWWPWLITIVVAAIVQVAVVVLVASEPEVPDLGVGWQPTAPVTVASLPPLVRDGRVVLGDGPAVIYFWATWCEPCVRHLPETIALAAAGRVRVWLVARDAQWDTVVRYFKGEVPAAVVHDTGIGAALGVSVLPTTFYIDDGHVRARSLDVLSGELVMQAMKPRSER